MPATNIIVAQVDEDTAQIVKQLTDWFSYQRAIATTAEQHEAIDEVEARVNSLAAQNHATVAAVRAVLENNAVLSQEIDTAFAARDRLTDELDDAYQAGLQAGRKQARSDARLAALADAQSQTFEWAQQVGATVRVE